MTKPTLILIGGPTASGKTALALDLARRENGAILNADAMQVYSTLPLLTAQPSAAEKATAPNHLYEIFAPSQASSVGKWQDLAWRAIDQTVAKGQTPILTGGTGLYFKALLDGLAEIPSVPPEIRQEAQDLYDTIGTEAFRAKLHDLDPASATKIKPNDRQRLIRAFEVARATGKPLGFWQQQPPTGPKLRDRFALRPFLLLPEREALYATCDARFLKMMAQGALAEVETLLAQNLPPSLPAHKILGVPELTAHLRSEIPLDQAIEKAQQSTRNYAKRQVTWFKNQWKVGDGFPVETLTCPKQGPV